MYEKSRAIVFERPRKVVFEEIPLVAVDDDTIVVKTTFSGISTGTDMKTWLGLQSPENGVWFPLVPGYEAVGKVVHVGKNVKGFSVGDRVMSSEVRVYPQHCAAWGGNAEYAVKNPITGCTGMDAVAKIPDNVSDAEAVVAYLATVAMRGVDKVGVNKGETVLVVGAGNVGLSACQVFKIRGAGKVIVMDIHKSRLELPKKFADYVVDSSRADGLEQVMELTDGKGVDVVSECSGDPAVIQHLPGYLRDGGWEKDCKGGRIHLQGDYPSPWTVEKYFKWFVKNFTLSVSCAFRSGDKADMLKLVSEGKFDAKSLYSKIVPVEDCAAAYEELNANRYDLLKILFKWE